MKTKLSILLLSITLVTMQACGPSAKNEADATDATAAETQDVAIIRAEKRAKIEKERTEMELKRKAEYAQLMQSSLYYKLPNGNLVYYQAETEPSFVGGNKAMNQFLKDNLQYPVGAQFEDLEGTVFVDFVVSANGAVRDTEVTSYTYDNVDPAFTAEAIRVVNLMPAWTPGVQNGKPVDVKFSIPITFLLN